MEKELQVYPSKLTFIEKLQLYLFDDNNKIPEWHKFKPKELEKKKRYSKVFTFWVDKPTLSEKKIVKFIMSEFGVCRSQAYVDMHWIKILLGNVTNAKKEWHRFKVIAILDKAYEIAEKKKNAKDMINVANALIKATQLDKEDGKEIPYDDIVPQSFEITDDVTVLGIPKIGNLQEAQDKMRKKYGGVLIEEAEIIPNE